MIVKPLKIGLKAIAKWVVVALAAVLITISSIALAQNQAANGAARARVFNISIDNVTPSGASINIRLNRNVEYRYFTLPAPTPRLVVDLPKVDWAMGRGEAGIIAGNGLVKQIRFAHKSGTESRIVIDLNGPIRVVSNEISGIIGSKTLRFVIAPTNSRNFAQSAPPIVPKTKQLAVPTPISPKGGANRRVIVIDPGHGGNDPGALGFTQGVLEKNVTLASAETLASILRRDPRFQVILTRNSDTFLPLERRIIIARDLRADLFISLHADAAPPNARAKGATAYTLSEQGGERSRKLLNRDNWTIAAPNRANDSTVTEILRDLTQRDTKNQSAIFAESILKNVRQIGPVTSSSHRRAGFFVLLSPTVPAVLFEMGFITDAEDQARLIDQGFRRRQMGAVAMAIDEYFDAQDARNR